MKIFLVFTILLTFPFLNSSGQSISISPDGALPDSSALLDLQSTTKGLLIPRMTLEQRDAIALPVFGLTIFQTDDIPGMYFFDGASWTPVSIPPPIEKWILNGDDLYNSNAGKIGIGTSTPEGVVHIIGAADAS